MLFIEALLAKIRVWTFHGRVTPSSEHLTPNTDILVTNRTVCSNSSSCFGFSGPVSTSVYSSKWMHLILLPFKLHFAIKQLKESCMGMGQAMCPAILSLILPKPSITRSGQLQIKCVWEGFSDLLEKGHRSKPNPSEDPWLGRGLGSGWMEQERWPISQSRLGAALQGKATAQL